MAGSLLRRWNRRCLGTPIYYEMISNPGHETARSSVRPLGWVLVSALLLRLALVWGTVETPLKIVDEQHYATLAHSVVQGHGFAWQDGEPTSIRPPLFPFVVAGVWSVAPEGNLTAVRLMQIPVALLVAALTYLIATSLFSDRVGLIAAAIVAFYPSLLFSGVLVLSEVLFTALLMATLLGSITLLKRPSAWVGLGTGLALGASALTRSVMWPFLPVAVLGGMMLFAGSLRARTAVVLALTAGYLCVIAPWSIRNTRLQETFTVVDTMGGLNLMMGNYEYTPEDRMWDAVSVTGEKAWSALLPAAPPSGGSWTEGKKDHWASAQAKQYIMAHPGTFVRRAVLKLADFWGIERDFVAGVQQGLYKPPTWLFAPAALAVVAAYIGLMVFAVLGICLAPPEWRAHSVLITVVLFICAVHTVVFGHSRYHLPLVPILALYAAAAMEQASWRSLMTSGWRSALAGALFVALGAVWAHELLFRDADRLAALARMVR